MYRVDLFKIGPLLNGQYIYATNGSGPVTYGGNTYQPTQFGAWSRDSISVKIGLESNSTRLTVFCDSRVPVYFPGTSNAALMNSIATGATIALPQARTASTLMASPSTSGNVPRSTGR